MKAVRCKEWGAPATLVVEEVAAPMPGAGAVRIAVRASGVNVADALMVAGQYQLPPPLPFSPGFEVAGEVAEVGDAVTGLAPGRRVLAVLPYGGYAEEVVTPAANVLPIPDAMGYPTAAAFPVAYSTAFLALTHRGRLAPGETLLVFGATGNVGRAAVEVGKRLGATVIATAGGPEQARAVVGAGADHALDYREDDVPQRVTELTGGRGAAVVFDTVGGDLFDAALDCIAWEGRILVVGFASGRVPAVPTVQTLLRNCAVVGTDWGAYLRRDVGAIRESLSELLRWYEEGKLAPREPRVFPLGEAPAALEALLARTARSKIVLSGQC